MRTATLHTTPQSSQMKEEFIQKFTDYWMSMGGARSEGKIAGYLLLDESDGVSAYELQKALGLSSGSISNHINKLTQAGFVKRINKPGTRKHFYTMSSDVWLGYLQTAQTYLANQCTLAEELLPHLTKGSAAYLRITNMMNYMRWMIELDLAKQWQHQQSQINS